MRQILSALFFVVATGLIAQNATLTGKITNSQGSGMAEARITVLGSGQTIFTLRDGSYYLKNISLGSQEIEISKMGMVATKRQIDISAGNNTLDIILTELTETLREVEVRSNSITQQGAAVPRMPGSSTFLSSKDLAQFQNSDPSRVLRNVPGVNVQEEDGFGLRPNIGMRGTGTERSSKITVMEDGILVAPAPYAAPAAYYFPSMGRMSGVEIIKGNASIKHGPFTTGGVLNMISSPLPTQPTAQLRLSTGSFNTQEMYAFAGAGNDVVSFSVEGLQYMSDGFKVLDNGGNTGFDKTDLMAKMRVVLPSTRSAYKHSIRLKAGMVSEVSNETYLGLTDADFALTPNRRYAASQFDQITAEQTQFNLSYDVQYKNVSWSTTIYQSKFQRNWYKLDAVRGDDSVKVGIGSILSNPNAHSNALSILQGQTSALGNALEVKANNRGYTSRGIQSTGSWAIETEKWKHRVEVGMRLHTDWMDRFQWTDFFAMNSGDMLRTAAGTPGTESNLIDKAEAGAAFAHYELTYGKWTFFPGLRYENILFSREDFGKNDPDRNGDATKARENVVDAWIPGMGITYQIMPSNNVFAGIHRGFAPPGSTPGTNPESSVNMEAGWRFAKREHMVEITGFYNKYSNLLGSDLNAGGGAGTNEQFNAGAANVAGAEVSIGTDLLAKNNKLRLPVHAYYTYTYATFNNTFKSTYEPWGNVQVGDFMPYIPPHQLGILIALESNKFSLNINPKYTAAMRGRAGSGEIDAQDLIPAAFITDASIRYRILPQVMLTANARNITDQAYIVARRPAGVRPGLPRFFSAGIQVVL